MKIKLVNFDEDSNEELEVNMVKSEEHGIIIKVEHGKRMLKSLDRIKKIEFRDIAKSDDNECYTKNYTDITNLILRMSPIGIDCYFNLEEESKKTKEDNSKTYKIGYHYGDIGLKLPSKTMEEFIAPDYITDIKDLLKEFKIEEKEGIKVKITVERV